MKRQQDKFFLKSLKQRMNWEFYAQLRISKYFWQRNKQSAENHIGGKMQKEKIGLNWSITLRGGARRC